MYISRNTDSMEDIVYICTKLRELGEYKHLVGLALKVPYREELHRFLYPPAYKETIEGLSGKYSIDPLLVLSIVREESRFDSDARSPAGALGLMQLMPHTAFQLDRRLRLGIDSSPDILHVRNNLHVGIYYLSHLVKEFGSYTYAIAAYNAGEEIVKKWLQRGIYKSSDEFIEDIPYSETRNYVKRVLNTFFEYKRNLLTEGSILEIPTEKL
jgi:soluble lytic murein transglycosylase